jgi:hypothetical protein
MIKRRPRIKQLKTFEERLAEEALHFRAEAEKLPSGAQRDLYLRRARQAETAANISSWLTSPGLKAPSERAS